MRPLLNKNIYKNLPLPSVTLNQSAGINDLLTISAWLLDIKSHQNPCKSLTCFVLKLRRSHFSLLLRHSFGIASRAIQ